MSAIVNDDSTALDVSKSVADGASDDGAGSARRRCERGTYDRASMNRCSDRETGRVRVGDAVPALAGESGVAASAPGAKSSSQAGENACGRARERGGRWRGGPDTGAGGIGDVRPSAELAPDGRLRGIGMRGR
jgi:hypothetical protein